MEKIGNKEWVNDQLATNLALYTELSINEYKESLEGGTLVPGRVKSILNVLTAAAGLLTIESGQLEIREAEHFSHVRVSCTSDKQARQKWVLTDDGRRQIEIKSYFKAIEKIISACKTTLRQLEMEARNTI